MAREGLKRVAVGCGIVACAAPCSAQTGFRIDRSLAPAPKAAPADPRAFAAIQATVSDADRTELRRLKSGSVQATLGSADVTLMAARYRSDNLQLGWSAGGRDPFSGRVAGVMVDVPIPAGWSLWSAASLSRVRRVPLTMPVSGRPHSTTTQSLEVGMGMGEVGPALTLSFNRVLVRRRSSFMRMAELAGGAPLAGSGIQLQLSSGHGLVAPGGRFALGLGAVLRPPTDLLLRGAGSQSLDRRIEASYRVAC